MRFNAFGQIARDDRGAAVCGWLFDNVEGPYQRDIGGDIWKMFTRNGGVALPVQDVYGGCNAVASSNGRWMRRLDGVIPPLSGSQFWEPSTGRVGDIDGRYAIVLDSEMLVMSVYIDGRHTRDIVRQTPFGGVRLKGSIASWLEFPGPHVCAVDVETGEEIAIETFGQPSYTPLVFDAPSGRWALYQTDALGGVLHRVDSPSQGYRFGIKKSIYDPDVLIDGEGCLIGWSNDEGQFHQGLKQVAVLGADMESLLPPEGQPLPVPPVEVPPVPTEPLAVTISVYTQTGTAPLPVSAFYDVTGHTGPVEVLLTIDGRIVGRSEEPSGRIDADADLTEPGEYRLGATVVNRGRRAETGAVRIVRVHPRPEPPQPPVTPPTVTGKDAYTLAAKEAREALNAPMAVAPVLTIRGRQFYDGDRLYVPRWVSGLTLLTKSPEQQAAYLDWAVRTGFNGVRVFAGALTWKNQTPKSALAALPALLDRVAAHGLAAEITALTDTGTGYDMAGHVDRVAAICEGRRNVVLEISNELGHSSQHPDLTIDYSRELGRRFAEPLGILWAVGATLETDEPHNGVYPAAGGSYSTVHLDRGRDPWNQVRRVREIYAIAEAHGTPAVNNEPIGADEKHGGDTGLRQRWNDPAMFFALGALDRAFGVGGVHHSQAGLHAELPGPVQQQCADAYVAAHAAVDAVLPGLVGQYKNVGHDGSPVAWTPVGEQDGAQVNRIYSFIAGDRGVSVVLGSTPALTIHWANGWRPVRELAGHTAQDCRRVAVMEIAR